MTKDEALRVFARKMIGCSFEGGDADGGYIQDEAERLGLIRKVKYNPKEHGPSDVCEPGDEWFVINV